MIAKRFMSVLFLFVILVTLGGCQNPSRIQAREGWMGSFGPPLVRYVPDVEPEGAGL
jgi:hypothetical protein